MEPLKQIAKVLFFIVPIGCVVWFQIMVGSQAQTEDKCNKLQSKFDSLNNAVKRQNSTIDTMLFYQRMQLNLILNSPMAPKN